jgi:hypothetical protein
MVYGAAVGCDFYKYNILEPAMLLLTILLALLGVGLIITGLYYQLRSKALSSDPILITTCYVWGGLNIATCLL